MPSGFQQDLNQLQPNYYRIAIDMTGYPASDGTSDLNTNGAVTPNSADSFSTLPTTNAYGKARARGNMRFRNIVNRLTTLSDCQILDLTITEANADTQATALAFTVKFERNSFIPATGVDVNSNAITTVEGKIKDEVVRGILDQTSASSRVYTGVEDSQQLIAVSEPANAVSVTADVTVTLNSDTTLVA